MQTFIDKYIEQGMQQQGNKILIALLSQRFGDVPGWAKQKIYEADVHSVEEWAIRLMSANTLDEVFH